MSPEEFLEKTLCAEKAPEKNIKKPVRTAAEIEADFMRLVEIDKSLGKGG